MVSEDLRSNPNPTGGRIRRLVFLAAHVLEKGVSFVSSGRSIPNIDINEVFCSHQRHTVERGPELTSPERYGGPSKAISKILRRRYA